MGLHWAFSLLGKSSLTLTRPISHPSIPTTTFLSRSSIGQASSRSPCARCRSSSTGRDLRSDLTRSLSLDARLLLPPPSIRLLDITYKRQINMNRRSVTTPEFCIRGCRGPVPWAEANNIKWRLCKVYQGVGLRGASRPPSAVLCCNSIRTPGPLALLLSLVDAQP